MSLKIIVGAVAWFALAAICLVLATKTAVSTLHTPRVW